MSDNRMRVESGYYELIQKLMVRMSQKVYSLSRNN